MRQETFLWNQIPVLLLGESSDKGFLFVHGQGGNKAEAIAFAEIAVPKGWQVLSLDLPEHGGRGDSQRFLPQDVVPELKELYAYAKKRWRQIALRATSIGAWFSMLAFAQAELQNCLFVSPVLDMELLIKNRMQLASVTEERLRREKEIPTNWGQPLSWDYLCYARQNRIRRWDRPTNILYAGGDDMTARETVDSFVRKFHCGLSVMDKGEHWFHTEEQLRVMKNWEERML